MRTIKFRAWNTIRKEYGPVGSIEFLFGGIKVEGQGVHIGNGWVTAENGFTHDCDVILEQFTGLHDRNGKEIYEGDVVRFVGDYSIKTDIGVVRFGNGGYFVEVNWEDAFDLCEEEVDDRDVTKIGDIRENPKLPGGGE